MFKKADIILIALIFVITALGAVFTFNKGGKSIKLTVEGKPFATYSLKTEGEYKIKTQNGNNTLVIEGGEAYFKDSDCKDKTCEKLGKIKRAGESIVCLPHRVVAEVSE